MELIGDEAYLYSFSDPSILTKQRKYIPKVYKSRTRNHKVQEVTAQERLEIMSNKNTGVTMMKTTNDEMTMMERYGITCEQKSVYHYKKYQYGNLQDAINFAKLDDDQVSQKLKTAIY